METPISTKRDLFARLRERRDDIEHLGVARLGVFGSFARDEQTADSDVDLLVDFAPGQKSFDHFMALVDLLEESLQRRVELVTREALSPYIGPHILREVEYVED